MRYRQTTPIVFGLVLAIIPGAHADDWPAFRGPFGNGVSYEQQVPITWDAHTNVRWKVPLARPANGSPIVSHGRVFLTAAEDDEGRERSLYCFDRADGRLLWHRTVTIDRVMPTHGTNPYGGSTPAADGTYVVVWHASAGLHCYDFAGKELWQRDFGEFRHPWGYGTSPVLHEDKVILHTGPGKRPFVTALRLTDGSTIWQADEPAGGDEGNPQDRLHGSWCTPLVMAVDGGHRVICTHPTRVVSYDLADGRERWWSDGVSSRRGNLAYASPIVIGDVCVVRGGYEGPTLGIRLGGSGNVTDTRRLWHHPERPSNVGSGVAVGEHVYVPDIDGFIACVDPATGTRLWRSRPTPGQLWGSIVYAGSHLYAMNQRGTTVVFTPDPTKLNVVALNALDERTNATPAISNGEMFLRTHQHLYCIGLPAP